MKDRRLDINEIFYSIDGEGITTGELAIFIRLNGCNLRCTYCDTIYALEAHNTFMNFDEIFESISRYPCKSITLTGGEPLCQQEAFDFIKEANTRGYRVNIETNGSIDISPLIDINNIIITLDIKTPSSKMDAKNLYDNLKYLRDSDVIKFVVGDEEDINFAYDVIDKYQPNGNIYLSPIFGSIDPATIVEIMKYKGYGNVRLQLQMHKYIWDPDKRGV